MYVTVIHFIEPRITTVAIGVLKWLSWSENILVTGWGTWSGLSLQHKSNTEGGNRPEKRWIKGTTKWSTKFFTVYPVPIQWNLIGRPPSLYGQKICVVHRLWLLHSPFHCLVTYRSRPNLWPVKRVSTAPIFSLKSTTINRAHPSR